MFLHKAGHDTSAWMMNENDLSKSIMLRNIRGEVNKAIEIARNNKIVGSSLEAKIVLHTDSSSLHDVLQSYITETNGVDELRYIFIVSQVEIKNGLPDGVEHEPAEIPNAGKVLVEVQHAEGSKCARCWNYSTRVGENEEHKQLCERCVSVLQSSKMEVTV